MTSFIALEASRFTIGKKVIASAALLCAYIVILSPTLIGNDPSVINWIRGLALAAIVAGNAILLRRLPDRASIALVWAELLVGFVLLSKLFDLDPVYLLSKADLLLGLRLHEGFLQGAALTLYVSLISIVLSTAIALAGAIGRLFGKAATVGVVTFYVSFFRGTPLLLQVLIIYLGFPQLGWTIPPVAAGILALSLNYGAYMTEIFRGGINSIPRGQIEAGMALALTQSQTFWKITFPQAMRLIIPATGNQFISMLKDSSIISILGAWELVFVARTVGRSDFRYMEILIGAALIYWVMSFVLDIGQGYLERYYSRSNVR